MSDKKQALKNAVDAYAKATESTDAFCMFWDRLTGRTESIGRFTSAQEAMEVAEFLEKEASRLRKKYA